MSDAASVSPSESSTLTRVSQELGALVERVGRSTVLVDGGGFRPGTGTIVGADLVLTANHVVDRDEQLSVQTGDERTFDAVLVGRDPASGLALLRVAGLNGVALTPAAGEPRVGTLIAAVSRTWDGSPNASLGILGGVGGPVKVGRGVRLEQVIRTDIAPSRGLSGSPLVTVDGEWLGLITVGLVRGVPIVIPHHIATQSIAAIVARGSVQPRRGAYLGVALHTARLPERQRAGSTRDHAVLVIGLTPDGPAERAGLLIGDLIVAANGKPVTDIDDLQNVLLASGPDATLALELLRGNTVTRLDVTIGERAA